MRKKQKFKMRIATHVNAPVNVAQEKRTEQDRVARIARGIKGAIDLGNPLLEEWIVGPRHHDGDTKNLAQVEIHAMGRDDEWVMGNRTASVVAIKRVANSLPRPCRESSFPRQRPAQRREGRRSA
jgi:hypothetical protein